MTPMSSRDGNVEEQPTSSASSREESRDLDSKERPATIEDVETNKARTEEPQLQRQLTGFSWGLFLVSMLSSMFLYAMDNTVLANVRPSIIQTLGHIELLPCVSVFYTLAVASLTPFWGQLNSEVEQKSLFLLSLVIFMVGSAINGAAQSMSMLAAGRFIAGIGGAGIYVGTSNIFSVMTMPEERAQYLNLVGIAWASGTMLGPIIGGSIADSKGTWRWAFYLNLCIGAANLPICIFLMPRMSKNTQTSNWQRLKRIDYLGSTLYCGGMVVFVLVLSFGGSLYPWKSGAIIALCVLSGVLWVLFGLQQHTQFMTVNRLFPVEYFAEWRMVVLFSWAAISLASLIVPVYTLPLLFQFAFGHSSLSAAVFSLPFLGSGIVTLAISAKVFVRIPIYALWFTAAATLSLVGSVLLSTITIATPIGTICGFSVVYGVGTGLVVQLGLAVAQLKKPAAQQGRVTAFMTCGQIAGSVLAISISTCIFMNRAIVDIARVLPDLPRQEIQAAISGAGNDVLGQISPLVRDRVLALIARDAADLFYMNVAGAALGLLMALTMKWERLSFRHA